MIISGHQEYKDPKTMLEEEEMSDVGEASLEGIADPTVMEGEQEGVEVEAREEDVMEADPSQILQEMWKRWIILLPGKIGQVVNQLQLKMMISMQRFKKLKNSITVIQKMNMMTVNTPGHWLLQITIRSKRIRDHKRQPDSKQQ